VISWGPKAALPTPADLIDLMEASKVRYMVRSLLALEDVPASEFSGRLWPSQGKPLALPYIETGAGGKASLVSYPVSTPTSSSGFILRFLKPSALVRVSTGSPRSKSEKRVSRGCELA